MTIQAPYRFVPLSSLVVLPEWADQVSLDTPFKDGICGELDITITTHGKVCVGGEQTVATEHEVGKVKFYRTPNGIPAIPGSSLKGMLRNVLEIATFSRFKQVEDQKLGVRDISESNNFYAKAIVGSKMESGWLKFENNQWVIYPCSFARVHQKDIVSYFNLSYQDWTKLKTVQDRYRRLGVCPSVNYNDKGDKKYNKVLASLKRDGNLKGSLVMTGQPGSFYRENNPSQPASAKKYEFIFHAAKSESINIPHQVMSGFRQIHDDTKEWKFWLAQLASLKNGIPVFYHTENSQIVSLGLAMMYKLAYKNSIYDAINHTCDEHMKSQHQVDFADLIFGFLGENNQQGLRGRVNIGLAESLTEPVLSFTQATVLSGPKPTYYPHYIRQDNTKSFNQLMDSRVKLSGWKRYPLKSVYFNRLSELVERNKKVQVQLETVDENTQFQSKIRLHNLRPLELGALLWSLDFGNHHLRHNIGMGKPYGLGQISLEVKNAKLRFNCPRDVSTNELVLEACRLEFENYMDQIVDKIQKGQTWKNTGEIQALLEYANPNNNLALDYLDTPKAFADLRKKDHLEEFIKEFHSYQSLEKAKEIETSFAYESQLERHLEIAQKRVLEKEQKLAREQQKQNASEQDKILLVLEDFIQQAQHEVTKTIKSKSNKLFKEPFDNYWQTFDQKQKSHFKTLATQADQLIKDNSLTKTVKKILNAE